MSITEAGLRALAAARKVEKETLPPDIVEGTVLSRELARVISYFPGSPRLASRPRKKQSEDADPQGTETQGADAQRAEAMNGSDTQQEESPRPEPGEPGVPDNAETPLEPSPDAIDGAPGEAATENAKRLNGNRENRI